MPEPRLQYLFDRYVYEKCSPYEEKELMELLAKSENEQPVQKLLEKFIEKSVPEVRMTEQVAAPILQRIKIVLDSVQNRSIKHGSATINKRNGLLVYDGSVLSKEILLQAALFTG